MALPQHGEVSVAFHRYELKTTHEYGFIVQDNNTKTKYSQFSFNIFNNTKIVCTDIYVIYRMGGPYWKNILSRSQKRSEAEGRGTFLRPRQNIFQYRPS